MSSFNLEASLVLFLHMQDKLMTVPSEASSGGSSSSWLFKNKEHGKASAAASLVCTCYSYFVMWLNAE